MMNPAEYGEWGRKGATLSDVTAKIHMKRRLRQFFVFVLVSILSLACLPLLAGLSEQEIGLYRMVHIGRQLAGIENDLRFHTLVAPERANKPYPESEIKALQKLKADLLELQIPDELKPMVLSMKQVIDKLLFAAIGIDEKDADQRNAEYDEYVNILNGYAANLQTNIKQHLTIPDVDEIEPLMDVKAGFLATDDERKAFLEADEHLGADRHLEAVALIEPLLEKYRDTSAEASLLWRYVRCHISVYSPLSEDHDNRTRMFHLIDDFVQRATYSPALDRVFFQWQTLKQTEFHGFSNWSEIPNAKYTQRYWELIKLIKQHLRENADDQWARVTLIKLVNLPIVERWSGYEFGSDATMHLAQINDLLRQVITQRDNGDD